MSKAIPSKDEINVGAGGEWHQVAGGEHSPLTTNQGLVIADNQNSLKANPSGPTMKHTLEGPVIGILIADGSDGAAIASVKVIGPKAGGASLADGKLQVVDKQLAGAPSVIFDAVAVILSDAGAKQLAEESAAIDFVRDAFGHLKTIGVDQGGAALLKAANVPSNAGVIDINATQDFIAAAKTRQWEREKSVRTLA